LSGIRNWISRSSSDCAISSCLLRTPGLSLPAIGGAGGGWRGEQKPYRLGGLAGCSGLGAARVGASQRGLLLARRVSWLPGVYYRSTFPNYF
jgi:hypothetical protein